MRTRHQEHRREELPHATIVSRLGCREALHRRASACIGIEPDQCALLPAHLHERAKKNGEDEAGAQRIAMDAITCLTEEQALRLYRRVTGLETGSLLDAHSRV